LEDWFATWFNSHYYHLLYKNRDLEEAGNFIDRLLARLNLPKGARVLDVACGKGRHSVQFRKSGYEVIGIDLSEESIEEAKLSEKEGLEFFVHDMRSLYWSEHFDLVVNLFTSFGYFHNAEDDQRTISSISDALKPGGLFVLDFMNSVKTIENLVSYEEKQIDGVKFELTRTVEDGIIKKRIHIEEGELEQEFEEQVDALKLSDFETYLSNASLELVDTFGGYGLEPFNEQLSDRLILIAQKPI
jgi:SAM-dependent methyltransferase